MLRIRFWSVLGSAIVAGLVLAIAGVCLAAEFSANEITKGPGRSSTARIYVKGKKVRQEHTMMDGRKMISISRPDRKVSWMLDPARKTYLERKFGAKDFGGKAKAQDHVKQSIVTRKAVSPSTEKLIGKETVNGYACDKYALTFKDKSKNMDTHYAWVAKKLDYTIRFKSDEKGGRAPWQWELKDIKEGGVPDSMFEIPKGYKKTSAEGIFGGRHHGPHGMPPGMPRGMHGMPRPPK